MKLILGHAKNQNGNTTTSCQIILMVRRAVTLKCYDFPDLRLYYFKSLRTEFNLYLLIKLHKMLKSLVNMTTLLRPALRNYSNVVAPVVSNAALAEQFPPKFHAAREVWIENFNTIDEERLGILPLHSDVFAAMPRIDVIHQNIVWQQKYRYVSFAQTKSRAEVAGGGRKPWPQKGTFSNENLMARL